MDAASKKSLVDRAWGLSLDDRMDKTLTAYFEYCLSQLGGKSTQALFFISLLKKNMGVPKKDLKAAVEEVQQGRLVGSAHTTVSETIDMPKLEDTIRVALSDPSFKINSALSQAVRLVWATHLTMSQNEIVSHSVKVHWDDSATLHDVLKNAFPESPSPSSIANFAPTPIKRSKLCARYLLNHADIELEWTRHLPDHLDLDRDGKKLRIFELVSMLEITKKSQGATEVDLARSLERGCFQEDFIVETLMTITLLFPPRDRAWLDSIIRPRRKWMVWRKQTPARDERLSAPFDLQIKGIQKFEKFRRSILNTADLFDIYPHWASRLQLIYEEAEDPTPSSTVAFALAILFGLAATILGALQLWVSYCQWQVPDGGHGCGSKRGK
ncbi:hypothetical protein J7T55_013991 [Diaporthe amygdali]|uniref:uncharacterized protein n=1 Tax=Phomopsis amygdali TaxID=1214568 RepID=UPI0022FDF994|nr:uncharacterized protein J7T55_013991 [Diaporthe amygdali]KAJ0119787.1 hypothetical protein J7T55_013991 [Diaporthe amygdali]